MNRFRPRQTMRQSDDRISVTGARVQLATLLVGAKSLEQFTAEGLARMYRVPLKECERRLNAERARRQGVLL